MFKKYKWNFVFVVFLVSLIGFIIFDIIIIYNIRNYLFRQIFNEMRAKTNLAVKLVEEKNFSPIRTSPDSLNALALQIKAIVDSRVTIIAADGRVISDSDVEKDQIRFLANHADRPEVVEAASAGWGQDYRLSDTVKRKLFYTAFTIQQEGKSIGFLRLAYYASYFESSMISILCLILLANIFGLIILFISAYYLGSLPGFSVSMYWLQSHVG